MYYVLLHQKIFTYIIAYNHEYNHKKCSMIWIWSKNLGFWEEINIFWNLFQLQQSNPFNYQTKILPSMSAPLQNRQGYSNRKHIGMYCLFELTLIKACHNHGPDRSRSTTLGESNPWLDHPLHFRSLSLIPLGSILDMVGTDQLFPNWG